MTKQEFRERYSELRIKLSKAEKCFDSSAKEISFQLHKLIINRINEITEGASLTIVKGKSHVNIKDIEINKIPPLMFNPQFFIKLTLEDGSKTNSNTFNVWVDKKFVLSQLI